MNKLCFPASAEAAQYRKLGNLRSIFAPVERE
jgi:hypothetical protein